MTDQASSPAPAAGDAPEPVYTTVADWVTDHFPAGLPPHAGRRVPLVRPVVAAR